MLPAAGSVNMKRINGYGESTISCLPEDILIDIFARLSIKAIVTCRCVSKTLRDLLSSSNSRFTKYHFARSDVQLIVETGLCKYYFYFLELEDDTGFDDKIKLSRSRFGLSRCNLVALNSCNGFLCLGLSSEYKWNPVKICNPITGEYLNLPTNKMDDFIEDPVVSGFGCTANTHQYKVVRLVRRRDPVTGEKFGDRMVEVYTIGTKLWRTIGIAPINPHGPRRLLCTTFFNGAIHWVCNDKHCSEFILSFDLESEKFGFVPPPPQFSLKPIMERYAIRIGVLGEFFYFSHNMELWVMKKYGVQESWTKVCAHDRSLVGPQQTIKFLSGGKILVYHSNKKLISYAPLEKVSKELKVAGYLCGFEAIAHVPSFMSFDDAMMGDKGAKLRTRICKIEVVRRY